MDHLSSLKRALGAAPDSVRTALSRHGRLRAGINVSNFLLVSSQTADGGPAGVSPDMASALAHCLDLPVTLLPYASPGLVSDVAGKDEWDVALIGAEPQRAAVIDFTSAYTEIEATYLVPPGSTLQDVAEVDQPGRRVAGAARTAYGLWMERNVTKAELVMIDGVETTFERFKQGGFDALGALRPQLIDDVAKIPGSRMLPGRFMAVQQAMGTPKSSNGEVIAFVQRFVDAAIETGFVAELIARHKVAGLSVAGRG